MNLSIVQSVAHFEACYVRVVLIVLGVKDKVDDIAILSSEDEILLRGESLAEQDTEQQRSRGHHSVEELAVKIPLSVRRHVIGLKESLRSHIKSPKLIGRRHNDRITGFNAGVVVDGGLLGQILSELMSVLELLSRTLDSVLVANSRPGDVAQVGLVVLAVGSAIIATCDLNADFILTNILLGAQNDIIAITHEELDLIGVKGLHIKSLT